MRFEYPKGFRFRCDRCAICCGDTENKVRTILLLKIEAERISQKTKMSVEDFAERIESFEPYVYVMRKAANGKCMFLQDSRCAIYRTRPLICRFYPFELGNIKGNYVFAYTEECPCIRKGRELKKTYFEKLFTKSKELMRKT